MTEKEKLIHGKLYDANYDSSLEAERLACKTLCQQYNALPIQDLALRRSHIKKILGTPAKAFILSRISGAITAITLL